DRGRGRDALLPSLLPAAAPATGSAGFTRVRTEASVRMDRCAARDPSDPIRAELRTGRSWRGARYGDGSGLAPGRPHHPAGGGTRRYAFRLGLPSRNLRLLRPSRRDAFSRFSAADRRSGGPAPDAVGDARAGGSARTPEGTRQVGPGVGGRWPRRI